MFYQDGRAWTVVADQVYELTFDATTGDVSGATALGTLPDDGLPVSFASNGDGGNQLAICGGGVLKLVELATRPAS